ncbi:hypothetical protein BJF78_18315 [Pseudonocardia sp. CNS-139]|nr:hypothetical protein BJF78_18315 [Pseudonocardia sp. CNS-139]
MSVSVSLAVALLALLVALFTLVALVAVYARVRGLEAARAAGLSGYATLVGRPAPAVVRPGPGQRGSVVAVLDADCGFCHAVLAALVAAAPDPAVRVVALVDRADAFAMPDAGRTELVVDPVARADLYEGYTPTVLAVDAAGAVRDRVFVDPDSDLVATVRAMADGEVARA